MLSCSWFISFSSETSQSSSCFTSTLISKVKLLRVRLAQFAFSIISPTSINVHVGSSNGSDYFFIGLVDDVRIYNRALSAAEVKELYEFEKPKTQQASTATSTKVVPQKLIGDPIVEKAIRERRQIPTGVLTKADLERVEYLNLTSTKITDASLTEVAKLTQLKSLYFKDTQITDVGVKEVAKMKQLTTLDLRATKVTKAVVRRLQKTLPKCKIYGNAKE